MVFSFLPEDLLVFFLASPPAALFCAGEFRDSIAVGGSGGALAALYNSTVTAAGCSFTNCSAQNGGATAAVNNSAVVITRSSFSLCTAVWRGAGVASVSGSSFLLTHSTVTACTAMYGGGGSTSQYSTGVAQNVTVQRSRAGSAGAAFAAYWYSDLTVRDSRLLDSWQTATIRSLTADNHGGCLEADYQCTLTVEDTLVSGCYSIRGGALEGAFLAPTSTPTHPRPPARPPTNAAVHAMQEQPFALSVRANMRPPPLSSLFSPLSCSAPVVHPLHHQKRVREQLRRHRWRRPPSALR